MKFLDDIAEGIGEFVSDPLGTIADGVENVVDFVDDKVIDPIGSGFDKVSEWATDNIWQPVTSGIAAGRVDNMRTGNKDQGIADMTIGISHKGMETYLDELKVEILDDMTTVINDTQELENAINNGWQGQSRDKWMAKFNSMRKNIVSDLNKEYYDLLHRLEELEDNYFAQDAKMIDLI